MVSSAQVENVLWGQGTYLPAETGTVGANINTTTTDALRSEWYAGLSEYDTTAQHIGTGTVLGRTMINPSAAAAGPTVQESAIEQELLNQINAGVLPEPTVDATGATNLGLS